MLAIPYLIPQLVIAQIDHVVEPVIYLGVSPAEKEYIGNVRVLNKDAAIKFTKFSNTAPLLKECVPPEVGRSLLRINHNYVRPLEGWSTPELQQYRSKGYIRLDNVLRPDIELLQVLIEVIDYNHVNFIRNMFVKN